MKKSLICAAIIMLFVIGCKSTSKVETVDLTNFVENKKSNLIYKCNVDESINIKLPNNGLKCEVFRNSPYIMIERTDNPYIFKITKTENKAGQIVFIYTDKNYCPRLAFTLHLI